MSFLKLFGSLFDFDGNGATGIDELFLGMTFMDELEEDNEDEVDEDSDFVFIEDEEI